MIDRPDLTSKATTRRIQPFESGAALKEFKPIPELQETPTEELLKGIRTGREEFIKFESLPGAIFITQQPALLREALEKTVFSYSVPNPELQSIQGKGTVKPAPEYSTSKVKATWIYDPYTKTRTLHVLQPDPTSQSHMTTIPAQVIRQPLS